MSAEDLRALCLEMALRTQGTGGTQGPDNAAEAVKYASLYEQFILQKVPQ